MNYFCTYFDSNYLPRARALYNSLTRYCPDFRLFCLCLDGRCQEILKGLKLDRAIAITLQSLEEEMPELATAKTNRNTVEYYYTCGPAFIRKVLNQCPESGLLNYIDADLYFFSSPEPVFREMAGKSIGIVEHRFSRWHQMRRKFGLYNVGWLSFRQDQWGLECLNWWSQRCLEWCYDRIEGDKYADQKYLDDWPTRFQRVRVLRHKGANLAPWNIANYSITRKGEDILVDGEPLIFFHFHGFKELRPWLYDSKLGRSGIIPSALVRRKIFGPYIEELKRFAQHGERIVGIRKKDYHLNAIVRNLKALGTTFLGIITGSYLVVQRGRVW